MISGDCDVWDNFTGSEYIMFAQTTKTNTQEKTYNKTKMYPFHFCQHLID